MSNDESTDHSRPSCCETESAKPKNVPTHIWERFKRLEKRTDEVTQRSTEKRIKHLKKQIMDTVTSELTSSEDREILHKYTGDSLTQNDTFSGKKKRKISCGEEIPAEISDYLDINSHLHQTDGSRPPPPTALEHRLNVAVKEGNLEEAEELSDQLATREVSERIVAAFDAKKFVESKKIENEAEKLKKKRKLNWGFEAKHKWETKGNM